LITHVDRRVDGDTWFPKFEAEFDAGEVVQAGEGYEIRRYRRLPSPAAATTAAAA
jgi:hypothetical protein